LNFVTYLNLGNLISHEIWSFRSST